MTDKQAITAIRERLQSRIELHSKRGDNLYHLHLTIAEYETFLEHIDDQQAEIVRLRAALEAIRDKGLKPALLRAGWEQFGKMAQEALAAGDGEEVK